MVFSLICPTFHQNHVLSHPKPWQCTRLLIILVIAYWLLSTFSWPVKHLPPYVSSPLFLVSVSFYCREHDLFSKANVFICAFTSGTLVYITYSFFISELQFVIELFIYCYMSDQVPPSRKLLSLIVLSYLFCIILDSSLIIFFLTPFQHSALNLLQPNFQCCHSTALSQVTNDLTESP